MKIWFLARELGKVAWDAVKRIHMPFLGET